MRSVFYSVLSLATVAYALAVNPSAKRAAAATPDDDDWEEKVPDTTFNGQTVPPMRELGTDLDDAISHGNWLVEFFSPKCPHCVAFKPTWQTLYEFYYTSKPPIRTKDDGDDDGQDGLNSFTRYYDFKIAKVDCIAFKDACVAHDINSYPVIKQFKDGKEISERKGAQSLPDLSAWVEDILEKIRPGSRVHGGPKLPKVGAHSVETGPSTEGEAKEVAAAKESAAPSPKTEPTKAAKPPPPKPKSTANPSGVSEELTPERFQEAVTNTMEPWFIKFYAPWCHHCQAMAPNWSQMAREMKGKMNVGEVNCDEQKKLCRDAGVKGYPTIQFFRGPERIEYNGMRGLGDFIDYANKAVEVGLGVVDVNAAEFKKLEETEEVIFTYFYDHATTTEDFQALERLTLSLVGQGRLVKTNDKELFDRFKISTWPRLMVSRDGKPAFYSPIAPKDMRDNQKILSWMKSVWLPIVPELKSSNARDIMDGKLVVLAILSRDRAEEFAHAKRELKNAALEWIDREEKTYQLELQELRDAKNLRIEEAEDKGDQRALRAAKQMKIDMDEKRRQAVGFAWVDGAFWERWIRTTYGVDVKDGERIIINDELNHRYWDTSASGEPIRPSRTSILEALATLARSPAALPAKSTSSSFVSFFRAFHTFFSQHWFLSLGCVVGAFVAVMLFGRRRRPGYFQVGEKEGFMGNRGLGKND